ncbi:MAG: PadR family transcriptional regulator [Candidatus Thorarchaeota archaeon]|nr:PadR family transcriptional regulator [Candidatus Thorarchaeota archaeon]
MTNEPSEKGCEHLSMPQSIPRGLLRHIIPRLLRAKEMTGTDIMQRLRDLSDGDWNPSPGTIYPLLSSLEDDGIIEAASMEGRSKTYRLTESGMNQMISFIKHQRGSVGEKTRLGPRLWEQLLDPDERIHFHMHGMTHSMESFESVLTSLDKRQQQRLLKFLEEIATRMHSIIDKLLTGVT